MKSSEFHCKVERLPMNKALDHDTAEPNGKSDGASGQKRVHLIAAGSIIGALLASSCCIAPLLLVMLGIGGAWAGNLTALAPYKPYFLMVTALLLAAGFRFVYFKPARVCTDQSYCARPVSTRITKFTLWSATLLVLLSATVSVWAPYFY